MDLRSGDLVSTVAVRKTPTFTTFGYSAVWVSNYDDDTVSVISSGSPEAETVEVANGPLGIAAGFDGVWWRTTGRGNSSGSIPCAARSSLGFRWTMAL